MARALQLAERGHNACEPNPRVGCVIVAASGERIGEGWHARAGTGHAEVHALADARERGQGQSLVGATAYVTLEPCAHHGRTPPCAQALIDARIARVVVAMADPHPLVAGGGIAQLRAAGTDVEVGLMGEVARTVARGFLSRLERGRPFVSVKLATSLDGATAMSSGESRWITGAACRRDVHRRRAEAGAILSGVGTVVADDPAFTVRDAVPEGPWQHPLRVVLDPQLRLPAHARVLNDGHRTLLVHGPGVAPDEVQALAQREGVSLVAVPSDGLGLSLTAVLEALGQRGVNEVMVEAGARLNGSLLGAGLVDEMVWYLAPHVMGAQTLGAWNIPGLKQMEQRIELQWQRVEHVGSALRIVAVPRPSPD